MVETPLESSSLLLLLFAHYESLSFFSQLQTTNQPTTTQTHRTATLICDDTQTVKPVKRAAKTRLKQMGKYMRRNSTNTIGEVSIMDMASHAGVRTRAKTLALQKAASTVAVSSAATSYIQLRSRRLVKPTPSKRQKEKSNKHSSYKGADSSRVKVDSGKSSVSVKELVDGKEEDRRDSKIRVAEDLGIDDEASFGENVLEIDGRERSTRETTPCNLIRDPETIRTPGSSTKRSYSADGNYRVENSAPRHIPSTVEMDEIFTEPEKQQQRLFIEKYNFDPVDEKPLSGRYEWVKVDGTKNVN